MPNLIAGGLASNRTGLIAALVPTIAGSVFLDTVQALTDALRRAGCQLMLGQSGYTGFREDALINAIVGAVRTVSCSPASCTRPRAQTAGFRHSGGRNPGSHTNADRHAGRLFARSRSAWRWRITSMAGLSAARHRHRPRTTAPGCGEGLRAPHAFAWRAGHSGAVVTRPTMRHGRAMPELMQRAAPPDVISAARTCSPTASSPRRRRVACRCLGHRGHGLRRSGVFPVPHPPPLAPSTSTVPRSAGRPPVHSRPDRRSRGRRAGATSASRSSRVRRLAVHEDSPCHAAWVKRLCSLTPKRQHCANVSAIVTLRKLGRRIPARNQSAPIAPLHWSVE